MRKKTDIKPRNEDGRQIGYTEWGSGGTVCYKGNYINGEEVGYTEWGHGPKRFYLI